MTTEVTIKIIRRLKVNVLHRGKERWKYCTTIERARHLQKSSVAAGLCSIIYEKINGAYTAIATPNNTGGGETTNSLP